MPEIKIPIWGMFLEVKLKLLLIILLCKFYIINLDQGWTEQLMCLLKSGIYLTKNALLFILVQFLPSMLHSLPITLYYSHLLLNVIPNISMDHVLKKKTKHAPSLLIMLSATLDQPTNVISPWDTLELESVKLYQLISSWSSSDRISIGSSCFCFFIFRLSSWIWWRKVYKRVFNIRSSSAAFWCWKFRNRFIGFHFKKKSGLLHFFQSW